uniref:Uncharacterized protein n=1 Tax=Physcomitrium patens TaxID=3218 RepID=A0A2K1K024_PHYPA|nr:hypothetical protein PHYPA_014252 [Physcomitrium patens]
METEAMNDVIIDAGVGSHGAALIAVEKVELSQRSAVNASIAGRALWPCNSIVWLPPLFSPSDRCC